MNTPDEKPADKQSTERNEKPADEQSTERIDFGEVAAPVWPAPCFGGCGW